MLKKKDKNIFKFLAILKQKIIPKNSNIKRLKIMIRITSILYKHVHKLKLKWG